MDAVSDIRIESENIISDLWEQVDRTESLLAIERRGSERKDEIAANLREALARETARADLWEGAAKTTGWDRFSRGLGGKLLFAGIGYLGAKIGG